MPEVESAASDRSVRESEKNCGKKEASNSRSTRATQHGDADLMKDHFSAIIRGNVIAILILAAIRAADRRNEGEGASRTQRAAMLRSQTGKTEPMNSLPAMLDSTELRSS